jgi:peptide/nickel transport system substrate-binding protein
MSVLPPSPRGGFFTSVIGLTAPDQVKVEGKYVVSFDTEKPNSISVIDHTNLYNPIFDGTKCKEMATDDDPWARKFVDNNGAGFGPYVIEQLSRGQQAVFRAGPTTRRTTCASRISTAPREARHGGRAR